MFFSEDAPTLENQLHKVFDNKKVNMVNGRREFFDVTMNDIQHAVSETGLDVEFKVIPEAAEYRESIAIRQKMLEDLENPPKTVEQEVNEVFPMEI